MVAGAFDGDDVDGDDGGGEVGADEVGAPVGPAGVGGVGPDGGVVDGVCDPCAGEADGRLVKTFDTLKELIIICQVDKKL